MSICKISIILEVMKSLKANESFLCFALWQVSHRYGLWAEIKEYRYLNIWNLSSERYPSLLCHTLVSFKTKWKEGTYLFVACLWKTQALKIYKPYLASTVPIFSFVRLSYITQSLDEKIKWKFNVEAILEAKIRLKVNSGTYKTLFR